MQYVTGVHILHKTLCHGLISPYLHGQHDVQVHAMLLLQCLHHPCTGCKYEYGVSFRDNRREILSVSR